MRWMEMESILGKTIAWTFPNLEGLLWVWVQCDNFLTHIKFSFSLKKKKHTQKKLLLFIWNRIFYSYHKACSIRNFNFEELAIAYV